MARYTGPKNRIARREGVNLGLKSGLAVKMERRIKIPPGQHGRRGKRKTSEYGMQLREKQKVKEIYGVLERQFRKYFAMATKTKSATGETLLSLLERRLDNVIFRLGFAPTRAAARQAVSHNHVTVNGKRTNIPSFLIKQNDVIVISTKWANNPDIKKLLNEEGNIVPKWLEKKAIVGKVVKLPQRSDLELDVNEQLIVEFYSR
jgi:small subunit ribosomal protein S4